MGDQILINSLSFSLQFGPRIRRVCQCRFRTFSFVIQAPRKTNEREGNLPKNSATVRELHSVFPVKAAGVSHDSPRVETCTFEGPGASKHPHQNSMRRTQREREKKSENRAGK